jgi:transcriptional regulator with XRE-family HTH domain
MKKIPEPPSIGDNVKKYRKHQKLSLDALAQTSGVSKAMLSQIESGKVNPTVATVWKIAHALELEFNALLKGEEEKIRKFIVNRANDISALETEAQGVHINVLSSIEMAEDLELYLFRLEPGAKLDSAPHYAGTEEYLTVLKGKIKLNVGDNSTELGEGDFASYECDIEHCIENISDSETLVHLTVRFKHIPK